VGREEAGGFIELGDTIWYNPLGEAVGSKDMRAQGLGVIRLCSLEGSLSCLVLGSGSSRGGGMKGANPPEIAAHAHAQALATDIDIL